MLRRFGIVVFFGIAFAYIEAAVVVYLREIFYPQGFAFPLPEFGLDVSPLWKRLLLTEIGREGATLVLILSAAWLFGANRRQRFAYFLVIFAVWDIFYYVWLKVLLNWPAAITDWDILFLIPVTWASPVLAPVLVSLTMLAFAIALLYRDWRGQAFTVTPRDWLLFFCAAGIVVASFCIGGLHITEDDFRSCFVWPLFALGNTLAIAVFAACMVRSRHD